MSCEKHQELMIDVLYGEQVDSRSGFEFFKHLNECGNCEEEYLELIKTRELLQEWKVNEQTVEGQRITGASRITRIKYWPILQKIAAGVLILVGVVSILQYMGYLGGRRVMVSERQLTEMVQDMIVARQSEERRLIGAALVRLKEDVDLSRRSDMQQVYNYLMTLEQRYVENLDENNRHLKTLLAR